MTIHEQIKQGMARAFFASAWADQCEECGHGAMLSGKEITALMPQELDPAAIHAAETLSMDLEAANGCHVDALWYRTNRGELHSPELWGHYAAMQAMGHGVGLHDYGITDAEVTVPYVEFGSYSLMRDYFQPLPGYPRD